MQILIYPLTSEVKFQDEALNVPESVDKLLSEYSKRFNELKTPRKLLWKRNLGTVKVRCFKIYKCTYTHTLADTDVWIPPVFEQIKFV